MMVPRMAWAASSMLPVAVAVALVSAPAHADSFVVSDIRLEGLARLSAASVYGLMPYAAGDVLNDQRSAEIVQALFASGQFEDVQVLRDGNALIVRLVERPSVSAIEVTGNKSIGTEELLKGLRSIGLAEGEVFRRAALDQVRLELQRQYAAQGRYNATVTGRAKPLPRNRVAVSLEINEGDLSRIAKVTINGNKTFSDRVLLKQLQLRSSHLLSFIYGDDKYSREKLQADLETLRSYYLDRGYLRFNVTSTQVTLSPEKDKVFIDINVDEGEQYKISEIRLAGELPVPEEELRKLLLAQPGQVYSQRVVTLTNEVLTRRLGRDGFLLAEVQGVPELDNEAKTATVTFFVNPNRVMTVRRINFKGNLKTKDEVLRREMRQFEGAQASSEKIDLSKLRLQRLGYFSTVNIENERVPGTPDQIDLNVSVEEQPSGQISASVGFSQNAGLVFGASVSQANFLGTGNKVSLGLTRSDIRDSYNFSFTDPYWTPEGISRSYNLYLRQTKFDRLNISNYVTDSYGGSIGFSYPIDETETIGFSVGYDQTDIRLGSFASGTVRDFVDRNGPNIATVLSNVFWTRNTLNRAVFPTAGASQTVGLELGLPGSDIGYYKLTYNGQRYVPLSGRWTSRVFTRLGYGDSFDDKADGLPFYRNFFGGGFGSVRGFRDFSMGPTDCAEDDSRNCVAGIREEAIGGNVQIEGGVEVIFPTPFVESNKVRTLAFFDVGNTFSTSSRSNFKPDAGQLRYSVGLGLSWLTPIGPLTFALSKPFNDSAVDDTQVFQFSLGQGF